MYKPNYENVEVDFMVIFWTICKGYEDLTRRQIGKRASFCLIGPFFCFLSRVKIILQSAAAKAVALISLSCQMVLGSRQLYSLESLILISPK